MSKPLVLLACLALSTLGLHAESLEHATLYLGWRAEPELGGFFQAKALGLYQKHGIDPSITIGNPQTNSEAVLAMGRADFIEGSSGDTINLLQRNMPLTAVAALFQKSPRVLIAHPRPGDGAPAAFRGRPMLIGAQALATVWPFLKHRFGYTDDQIRPYTFNEAPFLRNPDAVQEGYITEEPYILNGLGVSHPTVFLLSDYGYDEYAMALITTRANIEHRPGYVQRFVDATIEGWYSYLYGDPAPGNRLIHADNPDLSPEQIAFSISQMRERGLIDSGDAKSLGIGAMTDLRWTTFYRTLVESGIAAGGLDVRRAYTLKFVNKRVGL